MLPMIFAIAVLAQNAAGSPETAVGAAQVRQAVRKKPGVPGKGWAGVGRRPSASAVTRPLDDVERIRGQKTRLHRSTKSHWHQVLAVWLVVFGRIRRP